jgi:tetratricopeptide (TPR) repeat protein
VTGHFLREGDRLRISVEAIDVESARVLWSDAVSVQANNLIGMQEQIATRVQQRLLPLLGVSPGTESASARPTNAEAYDLYLRSAAAPYDAAPNKQAIAMLERCVGLDPSYGRAWAALGLRYSYDSQYSDGGQVAFQRSESAVERAIALDPTLIGDAAAPLILRRAEKGQLEAAYEMASALVERHPRNSRAQFALGYVFRYAGLFEDAAAQCEAAMDRDPTDRRLRSCAIVFSRLGRSGRARDFLRLDGNTEFAAAYGAEIFLREGNPQAALEALRKLPDNYSLGGELLVRSCLERRSPSEIAGMVRQVQVTVQSQPDPELMYSTAAFLAICGRREEAIQLLHQAIRDNYCSYPSLMTDSLLASVKGQPDFAAVVSDAKACREKFESYRRQHDAKK